MWDTSLQNYKKKYKRLKALYSLIPSIPFPSHKTFQNQSVVTSRYITYLDINKDGFMILPFQEKSIIKILLNGLIGASESITLFNLT